MGQPYVSRRVLATEASEHSCLDRLARFGLFRPHARRVLPCGTEASEHSCRLQLPGDHAPWKPSGT